MVLVGHLSASPKMATDAMLDLVAIERRKEIDWKLFRAKSGVRTATTKVVLRYWRRICRWFAVVRAASKCVKVGSWKLS